ASILTSLAVASEPIQSFFSAGKELVVHIKAYNAEESKLNLNKNLLKSGIQPFEITIENPTSETFYLAEEAVNLPLLSPKKVAWKISKESIPRSIFYKLASLIFWPMAIPSAIDSI